MARNKTVHLGDIELVTRSRSKYIVNKHKYINKRYNKLLLKDIVCDTKGFVYGVCDCECGEHDILTAIYKLVTNQTYSCSACARRAGSGFNSIYDSDKYIGNIYGYLKVLSYYFGEDSKGNKGVFWHTQCIRCGKYKDFEASKLVGGTTVSCGCVLYDRNNKYSDTSWIGKCVDGTLIINILNKTKNGQLWLCKCKYCGRLYNATAKKIVSRHTNSCGCIKESIGIIEITKYLDSIGMEYIKEWSSYNLLSQYGYRLRYDFALILENKVVAFIEYDGNQHDDPNAGFGSYANRLSNYYDILDSDSRKNRFAAENNIPLLRIKYTRQSEEIINELKSFINKIKTINKNKGDN